MTVKFIVRKSIAGENFMLFLVHHDNREKVFCLFEEIFNVQRFFSILSPARLFDNKIRDLQVKNSIYIFTACTAGLSRHFTQLLYLKS